MNLKLAETQLWQRNLASLIRSDLFLRAETGEANPGGLSLGRTGTVTEGLLGWLGGLGFLVLIAMWLTAKRKDHVKAESEHHS